MTLRTDLKENKIVTRQCSVLARESKLKWLTLSFLLYYVNERFGFRGFAKRSDQKNNSNIEMQAKQVNGKKLDGTADHKFEIWETGSKN